MKEERLLELVLEKSLKRGDFVLSSGLRSSYYFDGRLTTLWPEGAYLVGKRVFQLAREAGAEAIVAACPLCHSNLDTHQVEVSAQAGKQYQVPIFYFTELMGLAFGDPEVEKWFGRHFVDPRPLLREKRLL